MIPEIKWETVGVVLLGVLFGLIVFGPVRAADYAIELQPGDTLTVTVPEPPTEPNPEPPSGDYCVADVIQSGYGVDLQDGERLSAAYERLRALSGGVGGTIFVEHDTETVQCDSLRLIKNDVQRDTAIVGVPGPNGELPEFYCRSTKVGGTVSSGAGIHFMSFTSGKHNPPNWNVVLENVEVDGYGAVILAPNSGHTILRNNWLHHQINDGISVNGVSNDYGPGYIATVEACGNLMHHQGNGENTRHAVYLHRSRREDGWIKGVFANNHIHSCGTSLKKGNSCYKSTANENIVVGNRFDRTLPTPGFNDASASMLVDVVACAQNTIQGNTFNFVRPTDTTPDGPAIGVRNRNGINGCDWPQGYVDDAPDMTSEFWTQAYWDGLSLPAFRTEVTGNTFHVDGYKADSATSVLMEGTYPVYVQDQFGDVCILPAPQWWVERSRVFLTDNTFTGPWQAEHWSNRPPSHAESCVEPQPQPDLRDNDMIEVQ